MAPNLRTVVVWAMPQQLAMQVPAVPGSSLCRENPWPVEVKDVGCEAVVGAVWESLGLTDLLDRTVPADEQVSISSGRMLKALVLNIIGGRDPLYRVQTWAEKVPIEMLVGEGVSSEMLNDTSIGRHLDRLFEVGGEQVFNAACLRVIKQENLSVERLHGDTTSRLVFGEYRPDDDDDDAISITHGHSKDHRPDLKQVMYGTVMTTDGIPVLGQLLSGNTSDKKWHGGMLDLVNRSVVVVPGRRVHYVGDSALITRDNLDIAAKHKIDVTGRLPRTVSRCDEVVMRVLSEPSSLLSLGAISERKGAARYTGRVLREEVLGHQVQLGVYRPEQIDERSTKTVHRRQKRALIDASKAASIVMKNVYGCDVDGRAALEIFKRENSQELLHIDGEVVVENVLAKRPRGRPKKDAVVVPGHTQYRLRFKIEGDDASTQTAIQRENCFVLLHTGAEPISARALLEAYKGQAVVEKRFPFLKDPAWAEVFFLKTPSRVEALGYVLLLALLVWTVWERRVRLNLAQSGEPPIRDTTKMLKPKPTATVCRHILHGIKAVRVNTQDGWTPWQPANPFNAEQLRVIRFSTPVPGSSRLLPEKIPLALQPGWEI